MAAIGTVVLAWAAAAAAGGAALFEGARRRRSERERERLFSLSWDLVGVIGLDGRALALNSSWEKSLGFTPEELKSRRLVEFAHPDDRRAMEEELAKLAAEPGAASFQNRFACKDGTHKRLSWTASSDPKEGRLYVVARDAGARVRLEPSVAETRNFLDSIIEHIPNMVFVKDAKDLRFVMFNRAGEELLGRPRETFIGKTDHDFFPKDEADFFIAKDREALASGRAVEIPEEPIQTARKGLRILHTKKITIRDAEGKPAYLLGISDDITERRHAERMTSEIISMTTHELRTPLTSIVWGLDMLANGDEGLLTGKALEIAKLSHASALFMTRLINDYLDVVKIESGSAAFKSVPLDLTALVERTVRAAQPFAAGFGVKYELRPGAPGARVEADPDRLAQALTNLLSNAAKFSPRDGTVEVALECPAAGTVRVRVSDRGAGIPESFRAKVFQKFPQGRPGNPKLKGTGLGLSAAKAVVEKLKGRIGFESSSAGATFFIDLPEIVDR